MCLSKLIQGEESIHGNETMGRILLRNKSLIASRNSQKKSSVSGSEDQLSESWYFKKIEEWKSKNIVRESRKKIPDGILPGQYSGFLNDYKVVSKGSDDEMYKNNDDLLKFMPRGLTVMELTKSSSDYRKDIVISANRKFFECDVGPNGIDFLTNQYTNFSLNSSQVSKIISTEKLNGEAAHFSGRFIDGQFYLIAGSKNVHLIFQNDEHIDKYTDTCYGMARNIARTLLRKWNRLDEDKQKQLSQFLNETRFTVVCEILIPTQQHVVQLDHLTESELYVLSMTDVPFHDTKTLLAAPTDVTLRMFEDLGFKVPLHEYLQLQDLNNDIKRIRNATNTEGVVYYFQDSEGHTTGLLKLKKMMDFKIKSIWYILRRALREQACYRKLDANSLKGITSTEFRKNRARTRIADIQKWLHTTDDQVKKWQEISDRWIETVEKKLKENDITVGKIRASFPSLFQICELCS